MFLHCCLALLALSSLSGASDPGCEELIKPLEDRSKILGKWIFYAGTSDSEEQLKELKTVHSFWVEQTPIPDSEDLLNRFGHKADGKCYHGNVTATFLGNSSTDTYNYTSSSHEHLGKHLATCPDCMLWTDHSVSEVGGETTKSRGFRIFTKTGTLEASHLEVFKKQAECLNFTLDLYFANTTDLCPYESEAVTDARRDEQ
ncbi:adhesion G-protein coupled receptor G6 [Sarotherodon galilaeus]|uniref:Male-specific protein n=2 Tax=Sarotherodon galilaeus TaxID=8144 RepID=Q6SKG4_9CICH|nr:male-specific protein [Sarotherodon galilaeus]ACF60499.1 male-specific protein [Sarotherodon galilaeus]